MGYRSEIILVVGKEALPLFMTALAKEPEARALCYSHADKRLDDYCDGAVLFQWDHIKWYDSFPEIEMINSLIEALECEDLSEFGLKNDDNAPDYTELFRFVRLGEEMDDNEQRGYGFDNIYITRAISF